MKSIPVLGIPILNRGDLLHRCIASIDYPVETLAIVQNGPDGEMCSLDREGLGNASEFINHIAHIKHPNAGVGGSWNEVLMLFSAPWHMLVGNDIQFTPGDLKKMAEAAWREHENVAILFANHGHSFFVQTNRGTKNVGIYSPAIFPAYCEDCLWMWALQCVGETAVNVPDINAIHGDDKSTGSCTIMSDPSVRENNHRTHGLNFEYYRAITGGMPGEEQFKHPFNNPTMKWNYFTFDPAWRAKQQWKQS